MKGTFFLKLFGLLLLVVAFCLNLFLPEVIKTENAAKVQEYQATVISNSQFRVFHFGTGESAEYINTITVLVDNGDDATFRTSSPLKITYDYAEGEKITVMGYEGNYHVMKSKLFRPMWLLPTSIAVGTFGFVIAALGLIIDKKRGY